MATGEGCARNRQRDLYTKRTVIGDWKRVVMG